LQGNLGLELKGLETEERKIIKDPMQFQTPAND